MASSSFMTSGQKVPLAASKKQIKMNNNEIAIEFKKQLNSILESKPPISKDKMNQIINEANRSLSNYKHVVYYVENFIKNCPSQYKITGLYIIDAIIRNNTKTEKEKASIKKSKDIYSKRFSKNMCRTFTILHKKCSNKIERDKITRVLQLWQKYQVIENDLIEKLHRISESIILDKTVSSLNNTNNSSFNELDQTKNFLNTSFEKVQSNQNSDNYSQEKSKLEIDSNESSTTLKKLKYLQNKLSKHQKIMNSTKSTDTDRERSKKLCNQLVKDIHKLTSKILSNKKNENDITNSNGKENMNKNDSNLNNEISRILGHESDSDSENDQNNSLKRKSISTSSEKLNNCAAWLKTQTSESNELNEISSNEKKLKKLINLPDMSQPPPPLMLNSFDPPPPLPLCVQKDDDKKQQLEKDKFRERFKRGLPNLRDKHLCICSKTLWFGHLSKVTTEDIVIAEIIDLISSKSVKLTKEKCIIDVNLIPPRGCAYVEFVDRKLASKCLEKMKNGSYRLDGNLIKVAWATNKGINKDKRILKNYWNVEVGCTYIPWSDLNSFGLSIDYLKWAEGGLIDEESIPSIHFDLYKKQMDQKNNNLNETVKKSEEIIDKEKDLNDMDLDTDEDSSNTSNNNNNNSNNLSNNSIATPIIPLNNQTTQISTEHPVQLSYGSQEFQQHNQIISLAPQFGFIQHQLNQTPQTAPLPVPPPQLQLLTPHPQLGPQFPPLFHQQLVHNNQNNETNNNNESALHENQQHLIDLNTNLLNNVQAGTLPHHFAAELINNQLNAQSSHFHQFRPQLIQIRPTNHQIQLAPTGHLFRHINIIHTSGSTTQQEDVLNSDQSSNSHLINLMNQVGKTQTGNSTPTHPHFIPFHPNPHSHPSLNPALINFNQHHNNINQLNGNNILNKIIPKNIEQKNEDVQSNSLNNLKSLMEMDFNNKFIKNDTKIETNIQDNSEKSERNINKYSSLSSSNNNWRQSISPSKKSDSKYNYPNSHHHHNRSYEYSSSRNNNYKRFSSGTGGESKYNNNSRYYSNSKNDESNDRK